MAAFWDLFRPQHSGRKVALWYHPEYSPPALHKLGTQVGFLADRSRLVLETLAKERRIKKSRVREAALVSFEDLLLFHEDIYLAKVGLPETLTAGFGADVGPTEAVELVQWQRRATGGTLEAARAALQEDLTVAFNLCGGFHHAEKGRAAGFCVFNDIAVAIYRLRKDGFQEPIAIVDLDFHQGDVHASTFADDPSVFTYSIHGALWKEVKGAANMGILLQPGASDAQYLQVLGETLPTSLREFRPKLIFYVAGNDVLSGDRLGNFSLTPQGVLERDRAVVQIAKELGAPLVVTLGGGYHPMAWQCTANFIKDLLKGVPQLEVRQEPSIRKEFEQIAASLDPNVLQGKDDTSLREEDILGDMQRVTAPRLVLGYYAPSGIEFAFEKYGILKKIRAHGFKDLSFSFDIQDPSRQEMRIFGDGLLVLHLVVERARVALPAGFGPGEMMNTLHVRWLLIQNPRAQFSRDRVKLPGQEFPGMGIAEDVQEVLVQLCRRLHLEALSGVPEHYHMAAIASLWFKFLDPKLEGKMRAMKQVLLPYAIAQASEFVDLGRLRLRDQTVVKWQVSDIVLPVSDRVRAYLNSEAYQNAAQAECRWFMEQGLYLQT